MEPANNPNPPQAGTTPATEHARPLSQEEILELGLLAVEEPETPTPPQVPVVAAPQNISPAPPAPAVPAEKITTPEVSGASPDNVTPVSTGPTPAIPAAANTDDDNSKAPTTEAAVPAVSSLPSPERVVPRMEMSANTQNLKSLSRLAAINTIMNIVVIVLVIGIAIGGWLLYRQLVGGENLLELF